MGFAEECSSVRAVGWAESIGKRNEMEDGFVFVDCFASNSSAAYLAVYDGHGGRQTVDFATSRLHHILLEELHQADWEPSQALISAFARADREMTEPPYMISSSGCTACSCLLFADPRTSARLLYTAHLGDARAVLCRGGVAHRLTSMSDHKATDPLEQKRVMEAGGTVFNDRVNGMLAITRALGDHQLKMPHLASDVVSNCPDVTCTELRASDIFLILACDGLWDVVEDQEAVNLVLVAFQQLLEMLPQSAADRKQLSEVLARMLVEEALARNSSDNVTCMVIFL